MKLLKMFTLTSMVAAGTVQQDNQMASTANAEVAEPRQRRFLVSHKNWSSYLLFRQIITNID